MIRTGARVSLMLVLTTLAACATTPRPDALDLRDDATAIDRLAAAFTAAGLYTHTLDRTSLVLARNDRTELNVVVFLEDDRSSLQALLTCPWRTQPGDPARVVAWNATRRFSHAYLDEEGQPVMAADLILDGTTTPHTVGQWGRLVLDLADAFAAEVWPAR